MFIQRTGVVLCEHCHLLDPGVGHVAQRKVNAAVAASDRHCRNGSLVGELLHSLGITACKYDSDCSHIKHLPLQ